MADIWKFCPELALLYGVNLKITAKLLRRFLGFVTSRFMQTAFTW